MMNNNIVNTTELDVQAGIVIVDNNPYYYIERVKDNNDDMVIAYDFSKTSLRKYNKTHDPKDLGKASYMETKDFQRFRIDKNASALSKHLGDKLQQDNQVKQLRVYYKPALFVAPILQGEDSVTNNFGLGFPEMKKSKMTGPINGKYAQVEPTGVFIGLNNVKWIKDYYDFSRWQGYIIPLFESYRDYFNTQRDLGVYDG